LNEFTKGIRETAQNLWSTSVGKEVSDVRLAGYTIPERMPGERLNDRVLVCDGGMAFNALSGRKQRCWVQLLSHVRKGLVGWERLSDTPD
jgi:hypothetical protein